MGVEADLAERMLLDLLSPQALHINLLPDRLHVGVFVVPHSVQICKTAENVRCIV